MPTFTLVERPDKLPQRCASCGAGDRSRDYIDLDLSIDRYGRIYLCTSCVKTITQICGYVPARELSVAKKKSEIWKSKFLATIVENQELRGVVDSLRRLDSHDSVFSSLIDATDEGRIEEQGSNDSESTKPITSRKLTNLSAFGKLEI